MGLSAKAKLFPTQGVLRVECESISSQLITSYKNLFELCEAQLEAARLGEYERLNGIMQQKQVIMDHIDKVMREDPDLRAMNAQSRVEIRRLLLDINILEDESRSLLSKSKNALFLEMTALRTENQLYNKYNGFIEKPHFLDESK